MTHTLAGGITVRAPDLADLQAVVGVINACSLAEGGVPDFTAQRLLESWRDFDLAANAWVAVAAGRVVGYEEIQAVAGDGPAQLDGYVHPSFKGRGIGTGLLRLAEARGVETLGRPLRLRATIESANRAAQQLFAAEGYRPIRHFWRMEIALDQPPPAPDWPAGIAVRGFVRGRDERLVHATIEEAFADHWGHVPAPFEQWQRELVQRADFDPALWSLALDGDTVAGAVLGFESVADRGWVRGLGVRAPWRQRGLGLALLQHTFGLFYRRGRRRVGLAVDSQSPTGATRLYERAGMRVIERYDTCEKVVDI